MKQQFVGQPVVSAVLIVAVVALGVWCGFTSGPVAPVAAAEAAGETPANKEFGLKFKWEGVGSCTGPNCHGKAGPRGTPRCEYDTWLRDKHSQAYGVLEDKRSLQIVKNLKRLPKLTDAKPTQEALCLSCHEMVVPPALQGAKFAAREGVGCEMCHGPAQAWKPIHDRGWGGRTTTEQKAQVGFRNLKDLLVRVERCVDCHVGIGDSNVNHDLIAAGHPRLNFEYSSFLYRIPKHWGDKDAVIPDLEARAWLYGQVASARAALELLEHRARSETAAWPEFAEYDCFACHHDLSVSKDAPHLSWRQQRGYQGRTPGSFPWGTWYFTIPKALAALGNGAAAKVPAMLDQLRQEMGKPYPDRAKVAQQAKELRAEMTKWLEALRAAPPIPADTFRGQIGALAKDPVVLRSSWDSASQFQLAVAAVQRYLQDPGLKKDNAALEEKLTFPKKYHSPRGLDPSLLDAELNAIRGQLGK